MRTPVSTLSQRHAHLRRLLVAFVLACLAASVPGQLRAQEVTLLADLFTGLNVPSGGEVQDAVGFDGGQFFVSSARETGRELWITDGTPEGTRLFVDLCPGRCGSDPDRFSVVGGRLFFSAFHPLHGRELWVLAGADALPVLFADINPGRASSSPSKVGRVQFNVNGSLVTRDFVTATEASVGTELWRISGSTLTLEADLLPGSASAAPIVPVSFGNNRLLSIARDTEGRNRPAVFNYTSTSGPPVAVTPLTGFPSDPTGFIVIQELVKLADRTYFRQLGFGANSDRLWAVSDTTATASVLFESSNVGAIVLNATLARIFFTSNNLLHVSDGTPAGTVNLAVDDPLEMTARGNRMLFFAGVAGSATNIELFSSDGTPAGTGLLRELVAGTEGVVGNVEIVSTADNQRALIVASDELWISDGSPGGTVFLDRHPEGEIDDIFPTLARSAMLGIDQGEPYFTAGLSNDIRRLAEVRPDAGSSFATPVAHVGDRLIVNAVMQNLQGSSTLGLGSADGQSREILHPQQVFPAFGLRVGNRLMLQRTTREALVTNGFQSGTTLLAHQRAIFGDGCGVLRDGVLITHTDESNGQDQIWRSDGTPEGSFNLTALDGTFFNFCSPRASSDLVDQIALGDLFLTSSESIDVPLGLELSAMNAQGVLSILADINPGAGHSLPMGFAELNGVALFSADDGIHGRELWLTDGTAQGTRLVLDVDPGLPGSDPVGLRRVGDRVVFAARTAEHGMELWSTDGSAAGTVLLRDLFPGSGSGIANVSSTGGLTSPLLTARGTRALFAGNPSAQSADNGCPLFETDGTPGGTVCAQDRSVPFPIPSFGPASEARITDSGDIVFIAHSSNMGEEVHVLRNRVVIPLTGADLRPGIEGSAPQGLLLDDDVVWFQANDGQLGSELYRLDLGDPDRVFADDLEL